MAKDLLKARYFSHDCNARNDEKLMSLRMDHGAAGYGVYFMLLERCGESAGYTSVKDLKLIAFDLRADQDLIRSVIDDYDLFKLSGDGERFYSESFLERMAIKDKHSINGIIGNLIRHKHASKEQLAKMSDKEIIALNDKIASDARSGARSGTNRNKEKEKKEEKEREKRNSSDVSLQLDPLDFLIINFKEDFNSVMDPLLEGIKDTKIFRKKFNNTVLNELDNGKLKSDPKSLLRRLENYGTSWNSNEAENKKRTENRIVNGYSAADVDNFYKK